jgi:hypothetical protein
VTDLPETFPAPSATLTLSPPPSRRDRARWLVMLPARQTFADRLKRDLPQLSASYAGPERALVELRFKDHR